MMGLQQLKDCDYMDVNFDQVHCGLTCEMCSISPVRFAQGENIICCMNGWQNLFVVITKQQLFCWRVNQTISL